MDGADSAKEYKYDANGNVTKDLNRNILSIKYNSFVKQNKRRTFELLHGRDLFKTSALDSGYWF
jgi:hypothetical protein